MPTFELERLARGETTHRYSNDSSPHFLSNVGVLLTRLE